MLLLFNAAALPQAPKPKCPNDFEWNQHTSKCYKFVVDRIPWRMARERCLALGSDLVSIESSKEQRYLVDVARNDKGDIYWKGTCFMQDHIIAKLTRFNYFDSFVYM